jgi:hypothetical protein
MKSGPESAKNIAFSGHFWYNKSMFWRKKTDADIP